MSSKPLTRRRFLSICAAAGAYAALPVKALANLPLHRWEGILMGAQVSLSLAHPDHAEARRIIETSVMEVQRLENVFTLYDAQSELSRLNKNGTLHHPSPEMIDILNQAYMYHDMTNGHFDITVKPLEKGIQNIKRVGMPYIEINKNLIRFKKPGMGITLNGIAQGYITDHITEMLKTEGMSNVLVELGEKRTIGNHPSGRPWYLQLQDQNDPVALKNKALATSAANNPNDNSLHIFNPHSGAFSNTQQSVSVVSDTAAMADALSTGFVSMNEKEIRNIYQRHLAIKEIYLRKPEPYSQIAVIRRTS